MYIYVHGDIDICSPVIEDVWQCYHGYCFMVSWWNEYWLWDRKAQLVEFHRWPVQASSSTHQVAENMQNKCAHTSSLPLLPCQSLNIFSNLWKCKGPHLPAVPPADAPRAGQPESGTPGPVDTVACCQACSSTELDPWHLAAAPAPGLYDKQTNNVLNAARGLSEVFDRLSKRNYSLLHDTCCMLHCTFNIISLLHFSSIWYIIQLPVANELLLLLLLLLLNEHV